MAKTSIYRSENGKKQVLDFYEKIIQNWNKTFEQFYLETRFGETFILESGSIENPALILLHGSSTNSAMWMEYVTVLSQKFHVFAIDIIGECGKSSHLRPDFQAFNYAVWISEILSELKLGNVSIIACSLGGWIALDFANHFPEKLNKLVLLATAGITSIKTKTVLWIIFTSFLGKWGFKILNKIVYGSLEIDETAQKFASLLKLYYKPRTDVLPIFSDKSLRRITSGVYFIGGENDCFYNSSKTAKRIMDLIPNSKCRVLKNTGHILPNQALEIINFLNSDCYEI